VEIAIDESIASLFILRIRLEAVRPPGLELREKIEKVWIEGCGSGRKLGGRTEKNCWRMSLVLFLKSLRPCGLVCELTERLLPHEGRQSFPHAYVHIQRVERVV
jgi:hypothetical protein